MNKYKIVISDYYYSNQDIENKVYERLGNDVEIVDCTKIVEGGIKDDKQLMPYVKDADALVVQFAKVTKELIGAMKKCKVIARYAIGVDVIDITEATNKGIYVANVPDYCISEVANTALAHILNATRKVSISRDMLLDGSFIMGNIRPMKRLEQSTLCLLGFGNIARVLAKKCENIFGRIVVYDPYFQDTGSHPNIQFFPLKEALSLADVVSIHVPLSPETERMVSSEAFRDMKDGVIVVNTSRGGVVDESSMLAALNSGKVACCGLDVISTEDFTHSPLLRHPNVILSPHIGWCSEEAEKELQRKTAENVVHTLLERRPLYSVNKLD